MFLFAKSSNCIWLLFSFVGIWRFVCDRWDSWWSHTRASWTQHSWIRRFVSRMSQVWNKKNYSTPWIIHVYLGTVRLSIKSIGQQLIEYRLPVDQCLVKKLADIWSLSLVQCVPGVQYVCWPTWLLLICQLALDWYVHFLIWLLVHWQSANTFNYWFLTHILPMVPYWYWEKIVSNNLGLDIYLEVSVKSGGYLHCTFLPCSSVNIYHYSPPHWWITLFSFCSTGDHYNPRNCRHGAPEDSERVCEPTACYL